MRSVAARASFTFDRVTSPSKRFHCSTAMTAQLLASSPAGSLLCQSACAMTFSVGTYSVRAWLMPIAAFLRFMFMASKSGRLCRASAISTSRLCVRSCADRRPSISYSDDCGRPMAKFSAAFASCTLFSARVAISFTSASCTFARRRSDWSTAPARYRASASRTFASLVARDWSATRRYSFASSRP